MSTSDRRTTGPDGGAAGPGNGAEGPPPEFVPSPRPAGAEGPSTLDLPAPRGVTGHVRYTAAAIRFLIAWRRRLRALDADLSRAAGARDRALAALGQAARAQAGTEDEHVAGFAGTVADLERQLAEVERRRDEARVALDQARAALRARLEAFEADLSAERRAMAPHEHEVAALRRRRDERARRRKSLAARLRSLREELDRVERTPAGARPAAESAPALRDRIAELESEQTAVDEALAALDEPLRAAEAEVDRYRERIAALEARRDEARREGEAEIARLEAAERDLERRHEALARRRFATFVDLGRALARTPRPRAGLEVPWSRAREALERYDIVRATRDSVFAEAAAFERRPIRRTLGAALLALLGSLFFLFSR